MRKIKFRGKRKDNGKWIYGFPYSKEGGEIPTHILEIGNYMENDMGMSFGHIEPIIDGTLEEFTGCHDKNGKEVYEGNILSDGQERWFVKHSETESGFNADNRAPCNSIWSLWHLCHRHNCNREVEIIGDIHDDITIER